MHVGRDWLKFWTDKFVDFRRRPSDIRREGNRLREEGRWEEAAVAYARYLSRRPQDHAIRIQLGHVLKEAGDFYSADVAYAKAQTGGVADAEAMRARGRLALQTGSPSLAADFFLQSWRADPGQGAADDLFDEPCAPHALAAFRRFGMPPPAGRVESSGGRLVVGWVAVRSSGNECEVELLQNGKSLGRLLADLPRPELEKAGLAKSIAGFAFDIGALEEQPIPGAPIEARRVVDGEPLVGSPFLIALPDALQNWLARPPSGAEPEKWPPRLSFIMPVHNPEPSWLVEAISSVCDQERGDWELICIDDGSTPDAARAIQALQQRDRRIRMLRNSEPLGVSAATNMGLQAARGEVVAFVDHDDRIEPEAARRILEAVDAGADIVYSDEALTGADTANVRHVEARAAFSHDYYLSHPYFVHLVATKRSLALEVGGLDERLNISADVDFVLRILERAERIGHVPSILYRWRTHAGSLGHKEKPQVTQATIAAIERHLQRLGRTAGVCPGTVFNTYNIEWPSSKGRTLAIMPTKDRVDLLSRAVSSVLETAGAELDIVIVDHDSKEARTHAYFDSLPPKVRVTRQDGPFNFSALNNRAVREHGADYERLLFLNNDVEAITPGWADRLAGLVDRDDVGVAGASLMYPDKRVQHSGVVLGLGGPAEHAFKFLPSRLGGAGANPGPGCVFIVTRDVSAVTAACMMMRRSVFHEIGGFDESLEVGFNDTDLCLRARAAGYKVLNDGGCWLVHHESATRKATDQILHPADADRFRLRWADEIGAGDPWYSPLLARDPSRPDDMSLVRELAPFVSRISLVGERVV